MTTAKTSPVELVIQFETQEQLEYFAHFLDGHGEQTYWEWMSEQEGQHPGRDIAVTFDYFTPNTRKFVGDNVIRTRTKKNPCT